MNEELIKACAKDVTKLFATLEQKDVASDGAIEAIRLYHARAVQPLIEAAKVFAKASSVTKNSRSHGDDFYRIGNGDGDITIRYTDFDAVAAALAAFEKGEG